VTRKILLAILCVLALVGGVGGSLYRRVGSSIATHRAEIAALLDDLPLRHATRPALLLPEEPGNVWEVLGPAFESLRDLQEMRTTPDSIWNGMESNFNLRGIPADTPRLLEDGRAALDACRLSMRRSALDWKGPLDPALPYMAARAGRALSSKGLLCWQEGRDAEAMEWLLTALSVAYDAARLGQHRTWEVLHVIEDWVLEDARFLLSEQNLTAAELTDFERRLDQLRAQRPPLTLAFQIEGAEARKDFLEQLQEPGFPHDDTAGPGWKDLYSWRIYTARMLTGLRSGFDDAGRMSWSSATDVAAQWSRLCQVQREEVQERLLINPGGEVNLLVRLEAFRVALACARFQSAQGRMPLTIEETGYAPDLDLRRVKLEGNSLSVPIYGTYTDQTTWKIGRR
jgi:hypothetical protein